MLMADVDETSLGLLPSEITIAVITVSVFVTVSGPLYKNATAVGVDLSREYLIVQPGSVQVITTSTSFVKQPLSGVSTGGSALMMIGEARLATSLIVNPGLVETALISVPVFVTVTGEEQTGESAVGAVPSSVQRISAPGVGATSWI
jgi:hypothetical protein